MTATGNITEDLEAIRELMRPGTYDYEIYVRDGRFPWAAPATSEDIERVRVEVPEFPADLEELLRVTEKPVAGIFDFDGGLYGYYHGSFADYSKEVNEIMISPFRFSPSDEFMLRTNLGEESDDGWVPDGDLFWFNAGNNEHNFGIAIGGPNNGRIYSLDSLNLIQRIGWRLSDVVACTRELYENGWFSYFVYGTYDHKSAEFENNINELVVPVVEKWHCSTRVAVVGQHAQPPRPSDL